jgi:hypothetical protein
MTGDKALKKAGVESTLVSLEGAGHGGSSLARRIFAAASRSSSTAI